MFMCNCFGTLVIYICAVVMSTVLDWTFLHSCIHVNTSELVNVHVPILPILALKARHLGGSAFC